MGAYRGYKEAYKGYPAYEGDGIPEHTHLMITESHETGEDSMGFDSSRIPVQGSLTPASVGGVDIYHIRTSNDLVNDPNIYFRLEPADITGGMQITDKASGTTYTNTSVDAQSFIFDDVGLFNLLKGEASEGDVLYLDIVRL